MGQFLNERRIPMGMLWTFFVVAVFIELNDAASSNSQFTFITASSFVSIASPRTFTSDQSSSNLNATETTTGGISTTSRTLSSFAFTASTASTASQAPNSTSSLVSPDTAILSISRANTLNQTLPTSASQTIKSGVVDTSSFSSASPSDSSALFSYNSSSIVAGETRTSHVSSPSLQSSVSEGSLSILPSYSSKSVNDGTAIYVSSTGLPSQSLLATQVPQLETSRTVLSSSDVLVTDSTLLSSHSPGSLKTMLSTSPFQVTSSIMNSTLSPSAVLSSVGLHVNKTIVGATRSPSSKVLQESQTVSVVTTSGLPSTNLTSTLVTTPSFIGSRSLDTVVGSSMIYNITESSSTLTSSVTVSLSLGSQNATSQASRTVPLDTSSKASFLSTVAIGVVTSTSVAALPSSFMSQNSTRQPSLSSTSEFSVHSSEPATSLSSVSDAGVLVKMSSSKLLASASLMVSPIVILHSELTLSSKSTSSSRQLSQSSSFSPNKTSTDDGFIVMSYSTPCYIYYVVEKTVLSVMTANHTAIPATTPQVTLDIGSASSVLSELPTITLTQPVTMTTKVSEMQSQSVVTSDALGSSTRSAEVLSSSNIAPTLVSSLRSSVKPTVTSSQPSISLSESVTVALVSSQEQTGTIFIPTVSSSATELQSTSTANYTLGLSRMASSSRFSPLVATPSISNKQNLSLATATSTLLSSVELTAKQSSVQSTQKGTVIKTTEGSVMPSRSLSSETLQTSFPLGALSMSKKVVTSGGSQVMIATASSTSSTQSQNAIVLSSSEGLVVNTSVMKESLIPVATSSNLFATVSQFKVSSSVTEPGNVSSASTGSSNIVLPVNSDSKTSSVEVTTLSLSRTEMVSTSIGLSVSPNSSSRSEGQLSSVFSPSSILASHMAASSTSSSGLAQVDSSSSLLLTGSREFTSSTIGLQSRVPAASSMPHSSNSSSISKTVVAPSSLVTPSASGQSPSSSGTDSQIGAAGSPFTSLVSHTAYTSSRTGAGSTSQVTLTSSLAHTADTSSAISIAPSSSSVPQSSTVELFAPAKRRRKKRAVDDSSNSNPSMTATHSLNSGATQPSYIHTASAAATRSVAITADSSTLLSSSGTPSISPTSSLAKKSGSLMQTSGVNESPGFKPSPWLSSSGQPQISSEVLSFQSASLIPSSSQQPLASSQQQQTSAMQTVSVPSSKQTPSAGLPFTSAVDNKPLYSTVLGTTSVVLAKTLLGSSSEHISSFSPVIVSIRSSTLSSSFEVIIPSASSSSLRRDFSSQQAPLPSVVTPTPSFLTKSVASSLPANGSSESVTLQGSIVSTSGLPSSRTTDQGSQTLQQAFSSSRIIQRSSSTIQSEIQPTAFSSSVTSLSSSVVYRPPLVTISSLGICYVVYTTRFVQATLVSTPQVNMSSTASVSSTRTVSVSSMPMLPSVSLTASSMASQPTHTVTNPGSLSGIQSLTVKSTGGGSSSVIVSLSVTVSTINSSTSNPSPQVSASRSISRSISFSTPFHGASLLPTSTSVLPLRTSTSVPTKALSSSTTEVSSSLEAPSSQSVSPTGTVSQAVSSFVPVPPTPPQPPDPMLLLQTTLTVPENTDIKSLQFKNDLEAKLSDAYLFAEVTVKRRKRAIMTTTTVQSVQRLNGSDVHVIFYVIENGQGVPASQAAANYNKLSKNQLSRFLKLDVVSMPEPLIKPTTSPILTNYLVSLVIQNSAGSNISSTVNTEKLESNLASYYQEKQQLPASTTVSATIHTILHEPDERAYLEFYILVDGKEVNRTVVVEAFKVPHVNLLTAQLEVQVLVPVYIPETLTATELDHVIIGLSINQNQDLEDTVFRSELANKLATLYLEAKGRKAARRKRRSGSTSATIVDVVRNSNTVVSEADVTFFMMDSGTVANASYVASVMNRLTTNEMTTFTVPYAVLTAPRPLVVPTSPAAVPTSATTAIKWWIIPAVICPILLIIVIILLVYWRWKKGAPKTKVEPDTMRMLETNRRRAPPVHGFDVARYTESGVSGMRTTAFTSAREEEEEIEESAGRGRETSLRRKVGKPPPQKELIREAVRLTNPAYQREDEEEEEENESAASVTPTGSTVGLLRPKAATKPPLATKKTLARPQRPQEPQVTQQVQGQQELSEDESEEESEVSEEESETEAESMAPSEQMKHSAAQLPTVAVMGEASGPPRYPPVRFRSSVHPAPSLPPIDAKKTSLVGAKAEPPSEGDRGRRKGKVTKRELEQRADLERQKNKQRLRDRKRDSTRSSVPPERSAWDRAQHDFDGVLAEEAGAERVITGKSGKRRRRRPPSSSVATDEEGMPHLKSYRKLKSPKTTSSTTSTRDRGKKREKSAESASNVSSDESEIDMNETRRRMHAMLDGAFALFGPHSSKKTTMESEGQSPQPEEYPAPVPRPAVIPRYVGGHPALPEPPPAHGRATEPTPGQRRRVQPTMPGYPAAMPQTPIGMPGYPGRPPVRPVVTRDPIVVWDPADRQRILNQQAPPPTYAYRDPSGQNLYITPVHQQRGDMGGLVWSPYAAEDDMDVLYPDLAQASYPGALGTSPPKDASFLSQLQGAQPHDTVLNASPNGTLDQRGASLGQSPQPLIKSIKDELFRLSQGATRKTPITEL